MAASRHLFNTLHCNNLLLDKTSWLSRTVCSRERRACVCVCVLSVCIINSFHQQNERALAERCIVILLLTPITVCR
jgi:hypothetical protein